MFAHTIKCFKSIFIWRQSVRTPILTCLSKWHLYTVRGKIKGKVGTDLNGWPLHWGDLVPVMLLGQFCCHGLGPLVPLEGRVTANQWKILSDHLHPMLKHFYADGTGVLEDDNAPICRAWGVTEWFDEYENGVNHMLWPLQSLNLSPIEHLVWNSMLNSALHRHHQYQGKVCTFP